MATGVLLTGIIALLSFKMSVVTDASGSIVALTEFGNAIYLSGLKWVVMLAPLGIVFYMSFGINKMSASKALFLPRFPYRKQPTRRGSVGLVTTTSSQTPPASPLRSYSATQHSTTAPLTMASHGVPLATVPAPVARTRRAKSMRAMLHAQPMGCWCQYGQP